MKRSSWIWVAISLGAIGLIILLLSIIWILSDSQYFNLFSKLDSKTASELGAYISGFVGIFWTGAAMILIYATFKEQQKLTDKQQFESSFFNLVSTYHLIANSSNAEIAIEPNRQLEPFKGREFFTGVLKEIKKNMYSDHFLKSICKDDSIPEIKEFLKRVERIGKGSAIIPKPEHQIVGDKEAFMFATLSKEYNIALYSYHYKKYQTKLGHYFRFLYNIFKFTIEEREKYKDTDRYINLIQAQMSNDELGLLFYNALSSYGKSLSGEYQFYKWLIEYDFFENIDPDSLIERDHHRFYPSTFKFLSQEERKVKAIQTR